ncbi:DnaT-like ssDNA-binding domain-containing protein [Pseudomonas sp. 22-AL-CL-001]|uniref:DnaT-like ssDNA-binding domain-containing protein n=1 Tax=Pseudomonas alabamensis TaxID=3064349 RepID=UPI0027135E01|nr:DnaT-like ssDNA-binding domain-containing protein [Pseudomonas sp. 22-AL-CL-001]MDO7911368.1 DnaT-like ssDNA-binding domain-containing protein [Pseudomonas sp. 22-AL-CL-001]
MAGDWIKFELTTMDKPEVCQIADLAGIDPDAVVGKLMRVWGWFDQQTEEGNAPSVSKKLLDRIVGVLGFCDHMKSVGWMVEADGVISLPHFERHNGKTAKNRALTARRVSNHKNGNGEGNARSVKSALPREEKRREEEKNSHTPGADSAESGAGGENLPSEPTQVDPKAPVEMTLDWVPDANSLKTYCVHYGMSTDLFTAEAIAPFTAHHESSGGVQTQAKWVQMLVKWVKNDQSRASNVRQFPSKAATTNSRHHGFADRDYTSGLKQREDGSYAL